MGFDFVINEDPDKVLLSSAASHPCPQRLGELGNYIELYKPHFLGKTVNTFLPSVLSYVLGAQKNLLIETFLLSTHNICFG